MNKIRVIKKGTRVARKAAPKNEKRTKRAAARDMVANVSNWVVDFQERKRDETRMAIDQLFSNLPRTNES